MAGFGKVQKNKVRKRSTSCPEIQSEWTFQPTNVFIEKQREFVPNEENETGTKLPPNITVRRETIFRYYIDTNVKEHIFYHSNARPDTTTKFKDVGEVETFMIVELSLGLMR